MFLTLTYYLVLHLTSHSLATTISSETERIASPFGWSRFLLAYVLETRPDVQGLLGMEEDSWEYLC